MAQQTILQPPAKWVGRKWRLMPAIAQVMPTRFTKHPAPKFLNFKKGVGDFHDPFVGTGSTFIYLAEAFKSDRRIYIGDSNPDLINLWRCIKEDPIELLVKLLPYKKPFANEKAFFNRMRTGFNRGFDYYEKYERAATMLYLIQASFNSLWRVNSDGSFNVPFGKQKTVVLPTEDQLVAIAELLKKSIITQQPFEESLKAVKPNDVVYLDPPYVEVNKNSFTKYTTKGFSRDQQELLRQEADRLHSLGAFVYASNSDTVLTREIWDGWDIQVMKRSGCMNSDSTKRQSVPELLFYKKASHGAS